MARRGASGVYGGCGWYGSDGGVPIYRSMLEKDLAGKFSGEWPDSAGAPAEGRRPEKSKREREWVRCVCVFIIWKMGKMGGVEGIYT